MMEPGFLIAGRFRIDRLAGSGGMGSVYKAWDQELGIDVAVKLIEGEEPSLMRRFAREARAISGRLAALGHPGVVRYIDHGTEEDGRPYLVMEWLEGHDLQERIRRAALSEAEAITLGRAVCAALAVVHELGIIHRDIKPSNLFLPGGELQAVKVIDFGVVRLTSSSMKSLTLSQNMVGTPSYIAPEQAHGRRTVDPRADLYALGAVLYACLTQQPPFPGPNVLAVLAKLVVEPTPRVREHRTDVSPGLDALIAHLMEKDPDRRPQSALAVAQALAALEENPSAYKDSSSPSISVSEQDYVTVLLLAQDDGSADSSQGFPPAARFAAAMEPISEDLNAFVFTAEAGMRSAVVRAARCALALREQFAHAPIVIATGRRMTGARMRGKRPLGEAMDRAVSMIYSAAKTIEFGRGLDASTAEICLDEVSAQLIDDSFALSRSASGHSVLLGEERGSRHDPHTCLGRERELAMLESAVSDCVETPEARSVVIIGEAGVGKSRLCRELISRITAAHEELLVITALGDSMRTGSAFDMLSQLLRHAMGILATQGADERQARIFAHVRERMNAMPLSGETAEAACERVAVFIGELAGVPFAAEGRIQLAAARRDGALMHDQLRRAWLDWMDAETRAHPVVCVLDDLHWSDYATARFLAAALREFADRPLAVIGLTQPELGEVSPGALTDMFSEQLQLKPLAKSAAMNLVAEIAPALPDELADRLVEQAAGNPFHLRELARARASGLAGGIPESVLASAAVRLNACSAAERRVLRAGSVFGRSFWSAGVSALTKLPEGELVAVCEILGDGGFVSRSRSSRFGGLAEYRFTHELMRDAVYATLTDNDRLRAHEAAAAWLKEAGEEDSMVFAEHCVRGGKPERAAHFFVRAAEQAFFGNDLAGVIAYGERAIACGAAGGERGRVRMLQAEAHNWRDAFAEGLACGREAMAALAPGSEDWAHAVQLTGWAASANGRTEECRTGIKLLLAHAPAPTAERDIARYIAALASYMPFISRVGPAGLTDAAATWIKEAAAVHVPNPLVPAVIAHADAQVYAYRGNWSAAMAASREAIRHWRALGDERSACFCTVIQGMSLSRLGAYEESIDVLDHALVQAERIGADYLMQLSGVGLITALGRSDNRTRASQLLARFMAGASAMRVSSYRVYHAQLLLWQGQAESALAALDAASTAMPASLYPDREVRHLAVRGQALLALVRPDEAIACALEAMELVTEQDLLSEDGGLMPFINESEGMIPLAYVEALVPLVYAEALELMGERDEGRRVIAKAKEHLLAQAMRIEMPAWRESFLERVAEHRRIFELDRAWNEPHA